MIGVIWVFPNNRCVSPKMDGLMTENPVRMDDLGENPLFSETSICHHCGASWDV